MATTTEIAPDVYRISVYYEQYNLAFNQFLVKDEEPLLYHTGMRTIHSEVREAVAALIDPARLRWIAFSHYEADECGTLNDWLAVAPASLPLCTVVGALVNINDVATRPARLLGPDEALVTGKHRFRLLPTPHVPHAWDAGHLFEEVNGTLFCSDLVHQNGDVPPVTESDVMDQVRQTLLEMEQSPLAHYLPFTPYTEATIGRLADLHPKTLAVMHGSSFVGDGGKVLRQFAQLLRGTLASPQAGDLQSCIADVTGAVLSADGRRPTADGP